MKPLVFTFLLSYGGAVVSLIRPFHGLLIYICFAIVRPESIWFWALPPGGNYSRILAVGMLIGWALHGFGSWKFGPARGIVWALLLFWFWSMLSAVFAENQQVAWSFVEDISKIVLPCLVGMTVIDSMEKLKQLVWVIVLSTGYLGYELTSFYLSTSHFSIEALEELAGTGRAVLGTGLVCTFPLALSLLLSSKSIWQTGLAFTCLAFIAHAIFLTFSRGALLGMLVAIPVFFLLVPRKGRYLWALPVVVLLGALMSGPEVWDRFSTVFLSAEERDESARSRIELWRNCLQAIKEGPVLGLGPDHFALASRRFGWEKSKEAHNLWLQMAAELGVPGALGLLFFYGLGGRRLLTLARRGCEDPWLQFASVAGVAALAGFFAASWFVTVQRLEPPYYLGLVAAGIVKVCGRTDFRRSADAIADDGFWGKQGLVLDSGAHFRG
jgi:probable O-glycosylation ligase (exosortase A-associated)